MNGFSFYLFFVIFLFLRIEFRVISCFDAHFGRFVLCAMLVQTQIELCEGLQLIS